MNDRIDTAGLREALCEHFGAHDQEHGGGKDFTHALSKCLQRSQAFFKAAGADAVERGQGHIGTMPDVDSVVRHEVAEQDIPDLTGWEYQHMRPMVRVSVPAETPVDRVIQQGINMIRIGQMGTVLALMRRQVGTKYLRIPTYNDEDGAKIIFRHQGKWCLAGFFVPRERE